MMPSLRDEEDLLRGQDVHRFDVTRPVGQRDPIPFRLPDASHVPDAHHLRLGQPVEGDVVPALLIVSRVRHVEADPEIAASASDVLPIAEGSVQLDTGP